MITKNDHFPNLEDNHALHERVLPDTGPAVVVVCPWTAPDGSHFESAWDADEGEPWMVNCLFCEELDLMAKGQPQFDHGCYDTGDRGVDTP